MMAGETILIIDADEGTEQKIMAVLEDKGYMVFTATSQVLNAGTVEKLGPSLIYIAPLAPGVAGIEAYKTIHGNPSLKQIPIVLLESPEAARDLQDPAGYGVVGFLQPTFSPGELIKKTETILGKTPPPPVQEGNGWVAEKPTGGPQPAPSTDGAVGAVQVNEWESIDRALSEKHKRTPASEPWEEIEGDPGARPGEEPPWMEEAQETGKKRARLLRFVVVAAIFVGVAGAGLLVYQQLTPARKVWPVRPAASPAPAQSEIRDAQPEPQAPAGAQAAKAPASASSVPASAEPASTRPVPPVPSAPPSAPAPSAGLQKPPPVPAEPSPEPPAKPFYAVQIGAYRDEANAQDLVKAFLGKGYDAFVQPGVTKGKSPIYRVLVGRSEDRRTAKKLAEEIRSKERIETTVFGD